MDLQIQTQDEQDMLCLPKRWTSEKSFIESIFMITVKPQSS